VIIKVEFKYIDIKMFLKIGTLPDCNY